MVSIEGKSIGSKKKLFDSLSVSLQELQPLHEKLDLEELIKNIVTEQVTAFTKRQRESQLLKVLTQKEIKQGSSSGKITSGGSEVPEQAIDLNQAISAATDAFNDGLYMVFVDSVQYTVLEDKIPLKEDSTIMFIRLTLIAGG